MQRAGHQMGLSTNYSQEWRSAHYRSRRHDLARKTQILETTPGMEVHGQVGSLGGTRQKLEDERAGGFAVQSFEIDAVGQQGSTLGKGDKNHGRCQIESKQPLGQRQVRSRVQGWVDKKMI